MPVSRRTAAERAEAERTAAERAEIADRLKPTAPPVRPLTAPERDRLDELERVVERGQEAFVEVGLALKEIRDRKLYLAKHRTFEQYCRQRWRFDRTYGHRLIAAAEVAGDLLPIGNKLLTCEAQARELVPLSAEQRREVWRKVIARGEPPTAKEIREAVLEQRAGGTPKSEAVLFKKCMGQVRRHIKSLLDQLDLPDPFASGEVAPRGAKGVAIMANWFWWDSAPAEEKGRCTRIMVMVSEELTSLAAQMNNFPTRMRSS